MAKIEVSFASRFTHKIKQFDHVLKKEVAESVKMFENTDNHKNLKVHKLNGRLRNCYGFSVNYKVRIVFEYTDKNHAILLAIGDHDVYKD